MDELVQYARSLPHPLVYINVEPCLEAVPWELEACIARVTPKGQEQEASVRRDYPLNTHGLLQLCLLVCPPFLGLSEGEVRDAPTKERRVAHKLQIYPCPQRPRLIDDLVNALEHHEAARRLSNTWPAVTAVLQQSVVGCRYIRSRLGELRRRQIPLSNPRFRHRSTASMSEAVDLTADLMTTWTEADHHHTRGSASTPVITRFTLWMMADAFRTHVPKFRPAAISHALAAILEPLGIDNERGEPWTAAGIKVLFRRHPERAIVQDYARHSIQQIAIAEELEVPDS
jgi:hypothetical protein